MIIYRAEREAGLEEKIALGCQISYASVLREGGQVAERDLTVANSLLGTNATNDGQIDLFYRDSILSSIGWNLNDDVLDKVEVWNARTTPEDKPFNLEHDPRKVIGHITGSYALTEDGKNIPSTSVIDDLPDKYDLVATSVIYRWLKCKDEEYEREIAKIIDEIKAGEWFVSLEALFTNFDYAVSSNGENKVVARNESTAFLTKHLRAYGGDGVYSGYKIGRLLRNLTFSGKGLVRNPANPRGIIFNNVSHFVNSGYITLSDKKVENDMADNALQDRINSLEASLKTASEQNVSLQKQLTDLGQQQVQAKISGLEDEIKKRDEKVNSLSAQVTTEQTARTAAEKLIEELKTSLSTANTTLNELKLKQIKADRVSKWVAKTGLEMTEAEKRVDKFLSLDDATFDAVLETQPGKQTTNVTTASKDVLDNAQVVKDAPLTSSDNSGVNLVQSALKKIYAKSRMTVNSDNNDDGE
jgi:hypothetical protein